MPDSAPKAIDKQLVDDLRFRAHMVSMADGSQRDYKLAESLRETANVIEAWLIK